MYLSGGNWEGTPEGESGGERKVKDTERERRCIEGGIWPTQKFWRDASCVGCVIASRKLLNIRPG